MLNDIEHLKKLYIPVNPLYSAQLFTVPIYTASDSSWTKEKTAIDRLRH